MVRILNPTVMVGKVAYVAVFQELEAISASELGEVMGDLTPQRAALIAALDFVFSGS